MTSDARSHGLMLRSLLTRAEAETHAATAELLAPLDALFDEPMQEVTGGRTTGMEFTDGVLVAGSVALPELWSSRSAVRVLTLVERVDTPNALTGVGYGVNNPPVRIAGEWSSSDV